MSPKRLTAMPAGHKGNDSANTIRTGYALRVSWSIRLSLLCRHKPVAAFLSSGGVLRSTKKGRAVVNMPKGFLAGSRLPSRRRPFRRGDQKGQPPPGPALRVSACTAEDRAAPRGRPFRLRPDLPAPMSAAPCRYRPRRPPCGKRH